MSINKVQLHQVQPLFLAVLISRFAAHKLLAVEKSNFLARPLTGTFFGTDVHIFVTALGPCDKANWHLSSKQPSSQLFTQQVDCQIFYIFFSTVILW